jgi:hypothetical protein
MMPEHVEQWLLSHPPTPLQIDCVVTIMLKILDGKCKMPEAEKVVITLVYDRVKLQSGELFTGEIHHLIARARVQHDNEALKMQIYEMRLLAETQLSRPVMKKFKAYIREQGLLTAFSREAED